MRALTLAVSLSILCACNGDDVTDVNGPLSMTVRATSVGLGDTITAVVTNRSRIEFAYDAVSGCGSNQGPFERLVGRDWMRPVLSDTLPCASLVFSGALQAGASQTYMWAAPSDTGTYRVAFGLGPVALISHPFLVR